MPGPIIQQDYAGQVHVVHMRMTHITAADHLGINMHSPGHALRALHEEHAPCEDAAVASQMSKLYASKHVRVSTQ